MEFSLCILMLLLTVKGFSQTQVNSKTPDNLKYSAEDSIVTDANDRMLKLHGHVKIQIDKINIEADQVFFDRKTKQIMAIGVQHYAFPFTVDSSLLNRKKSLKYTLGENTVFIN